MIIDKQPVSVTSAEPGNTSDITSLRLSLTWVPSLSADSQITFYALCRAPSSTWPPTAFALDSDIRLDETSRPFSYRT